MSSGIYDDSNCLTSGVHNGIKDGAWDAQIDWEKFDPEAVRLQIADRIREDALVYVAKAEIKIREGDESWKLITFEWVSILMREAMNRYDRMVEHMREEQEQFLADQTHRDGWAPMENSTNTLNFLARKLAVPSSIKASKELRERQ